MLDILCYVYNIVVICNVSQVVRLYNEVQTGERSPWELIQGLQVGFKLTSF